MIFDSQEQKDTILTVFQSAQVQTTVGAARDSLRLALETLDAIENGEVTQNQATEEPA